MKEADAVSQEIVGSIDIEASVEQIWEAVSTEEGLRYWFNSTVTLEPGADRRVSWVGETSTDTATFAGSIIERDQPRRLTIEWNRTDHPWPGPVRTTIEIADGDPSASVTLRHTGIENLPEDQRDTGDTDLRQSWVDDELIPLREYVTGAAPTY